MRELARPSSGSIHVRGYPVPRESRRALERVGGIVEEPHFYPYLSGRRNLRLWARSYGGEAHDRVDAALDRAGCSSPPSRSPS